MENTPLKTNRMPFFNRYQAMGSQVSFFKFPDLMHFLAKDFLHNLDLISTLCLLTGSRRVSTIEERI